MSWGKHWILVNMFIVNDVNNINIKNRKINLEISAQIVDMPHLFCDTCTKLWVDQFAGEYSCKFFRLEYSLLNRHLEMLTITVTCI